MRVYHYDVDGSRHCREGVAVEQRGVLFDTFWGAGDSYSHRLTETEAKTAEFLFDTDEYRELDRYSRGAPAEWRTYAPKDRGAIPSQHGLRCRYFIRKGARPDMATQIENARQKVADAENALHSAETRLRWAREELAALEGGAS